MRRYLALVLLVTGLVAPGLAQQLQLPNRSGTVKFAVLGDTGTGTKSQYAVGKRAAAARATFPFTFALLGSDWWICFFHHPLYSSGDRHGAAEVQREQLEPIFVKHGVDVVLSGHEHLYERIKPQKEIAYFTIGTPPSCGTSRV